MKNSSKNIQKTSKCFKEKTQKEKYYFIDEYTLFLNPLLFLKGQNENSKKLD